MFIAASPIPQFLAIAERVHRCHKGKVIGEEYVSLPRSEIIVSEWLSLIHSGESGLSQQKLNRILAKLKLHKADLVRWLNSSQKNERTFQDRPVEAIRAAIPGVDEDLIKDLELISRTFGRNVL